ncbi:serine hydrolase domain-containing protein [Pseudomonas sp. zfem005]|uniref:serine hydrolase domain-containing protein n=1 Tax=Pseudomonas sp. zfem005 TaxID=3078200 RepID=UPI0029284B39|nr:serine hydrolase domain-containing protein [Pseudomonas sp. zfem005]MDU9415898.1 serine hydrolase domain-containing protein [Pseudomonas sp. zfem005]
MFHALRLPLLGCLLGGTGCQALPVTPAPDIRQGDYSELIVYLQEHIRQQMQAHDIPGLALALVDDQQVIWARGFGYADRERRIAASEYTAFRIGSLSKPITASLAMQLRERGALDLDTPLQSSLREFYVRSRFHTDQAAADRAITLRRLLSHQSGLPTDHLEGQVAKLPLPLGELPALASGTWLSHQPGTQTVYSNLGYALVGAAIERTSGCEFEACAQKSLLQPLDMRHASFLGNSGQQPYRARGYMKGKPSADLNIRDLSAGSLWASPVDLSHFVQMVFADGRYQGRQVLQPASIQEMLHPQNVGNALDLDCSIGLGWFLGTYGDELATPGLRVVEHSGSTGDFNAQMTLLPEQRLGVVVLTNSDSAAAVTSQLASLSLRLLLQARDGKPASPPGPPRRTNRQRPSPQDRQRLDGRYATGSGLIHIRSQGERLYAELSGLRVELLRDDEGWLRARKKLLGLWPLDLGELGRPQLDVVTLQGRQALVGRQHGQTLFIGERVDAMPIPREWAAMVGDYRIAGGKDDTLSLSLRLEDGFLLARGRSAGEPIGDYILHPQDSAHATLAGSGRGLGDTLSLRPDGFEALGYRFVRTDKKP